jgi:peptidoglycan hydrolase CwlO-like protein
MDFEESFAKRLANDLEQGVYANADDFAAGITKHYMSSLSLNAPVGIPITMPSPLAAGAPVPVGPSNSITNRTREKIFYNTVRAYFVGKEISQGKIRIQSLSQDIQGAIATYNKLTTDVQNLQIQIQNLDDQLREIRENIQSLIPEFRKFIATKKEVIKSTFDEIKTLGDKFKQLNAQNLSNFDFNTVMGEEIADLQALLSLKVEPSLNIASIAETFQTLASYAKKAKQVTDKYKNKFSNEANFKTYVRKKLAVVVREFMKLLDGFINPEKFIGYWKELIYVPGGKVIGRTMIKVIENNAKLKELKKSLLAKVEAKKQSVRAQLDKKLEDLKAKLTDTIKRVQSKIAKERELNGQTKKKERLAAGQKIKETAKRVKAKAKKIRRAIRHYRLILDTVQSIFTKLFAIYATMKKAIEKAVN